MRVERGPDMSGPRTTLFYCSRVIVAGDETDPFYAPATHEAARLAIEFERAPTALKPVREIG